MPSQINSDDNYPRKRIAVRDSEMAYVDSGASRVCVFLHGNPINPYLWRNVIAHLDPAARCIAPDVCWHGRIGAVTKAELPII